MNNETAALLEKHFDTAFDSPNGIKKLRELILTLAMQGKLVPQDPIDRPASELLKAIETEKKALVKEGKIKTPKPLPEVTPDEISHNLPKSWEWVRLGEIGEINPRNVCNDDTEVGFVPMPLIFAGYRVPHKFEVRRWFEIKKGYTHFADGDIALAKITPCFENKKSCIFKNLPNGIGAGTTEIHIFRNTFKSIYPEYLLAYLKDPRYISLGTSKMTGSAGQKRVPTDFFTLNPFPLPPLAEQHRIVAEIDRLMARCDELEKLRTDRTQKRTIVHTAAIDRLLTAKDDRDFSNAWSFITQHFRELYSVKENVIELRKVILQLAVMGKLVPQDPNDEPASELLKAIELEKQRLVKEGEIKKPKILPNIKLEEIPYPLPKSWEWVRFFTINTVKSELVSAKDYPLENQIAPDSIEKGSGRLLLHRTVEEFGATGPNNRFHKGQILYSKIRPSLNKAVIAPYEGLCSADMYPIQTFVDLKFMLKVILSEVFLEQVRQAENRVKMPKLNLESLSIFQIPLPPLAEQHRIVAKIDRLMELCDRLEASIEATKLKQSDLLNAVMSRV